MEMNVDPKHEPHQGNRIRAKRARRERQEEVLDDALKSTFPASDPVSIEHPTPPATDRNQKINLADKETFNMSRPPFPSLQRPIATSRVAGGRRRKY